MTASPGIRSSVLAQPLRIGGVTVPNRIMQTAHSKQYSDRVESDRETAYYVRRALGGCGLFVAGNHFVHPTGSIRGFEDAYRPEGVAASKGMTDAVHEAGAKIFVQLNHHGAQAQPDGPDGPRTVYAPSRLISPSTGHATREMDHADIASFARGWALSAEYARDGGFDGVEIHLAHGYLLHQFLSPLYNARQDEYGGDLDGRTRFPREVLRAVRARVGDDFTVGIRIVANEFHPDGIDGAGMREVIARLRQEARIDFLDLAAGGYHNVHYVFPSSPMPYAWLRDDVAAVKAANPDVPVFGVGAARSVEEAEDVVASGIADMVALTRAQIADPDLGRKLLGLAPVDTGERGIRHCIRLNQGCLGRGSRGLAMSCTVNPLAGRELERGERPRTASPQRWVVVGGGPAGMRAAVELASDGHAVTLLERAHELGGQLRLARRVPGRESVGLLVDDLERDLGAAGVDVRLGVEATAETVRGLGIVDGVVVATGAVAPATTSLALGGAYTDGFPVAGTIDAFAAASGAPLGRRIAVVDADGTAYAAGIVLSLLDRVDELELFTPFETVFPHIGAGYDRPLLLERLGAHAGFRRSVAYRVESIEPGAVTARDMLTGAADAIPGVDTVVAIEPRASVGVPGLATDTAAAASGSPRVVVIADAFAPRSIDAAIFEAVELAYDVAGLATLRG
ncbi:2,4-dienoyl-CoA reductase-like NADH-dependent reductase (Old Yellow Enzyme family) [Microbacterium trichothecenolyticum]|uniref:oxidoreductase n=1 Tax=Microbacterium trichothecenolyticum TaxID=69370 RepID=UPI0028598E8C|nr:NAD(P)-binding protein [Microbacterium trichothecenolyticum]MDR7184720.1 2,4-dienoyl-CoA reductase-like NADH-dependent reductase (Old Yellow Enzyme family) [Microbacterium trichothecenolyticum]